MSMTCRLRRPLLLSLMLGGHLLSLGCATTHIVNGKRVTDLDAIESIDAPPALRHGSVAAATSPTASEAKHPVSRERRRRFARHGDDRVAAWRYGAIGDPRLLPLLDEAEAQASGGGLKVLQTGRRLTIDERRVIRGSCWTFASGVYKHAEIRRTTVHKGRKSGPFADPDSFEPGDFLSYVNHSWRGSLHSAIFVTWVDRGRLEALMMSYVGGNKRTPGGYRTYRLSHVFRVQRAVAQSGTLR